MSYKQNQMCKNSSSQKMFEIKLWIKIIYYIIVYL